MYSNMGITRRALWYYKEKVAYKDIAPCPHFSKCLSIMQSEFFQRYLTAIRTYFTRWLIRTDSYDLTRTKWYIPSDG